MNNSRFWAWAKKLQMREPDGGKAGILTRCGQIRIPEIYETGRQAGGWAKPSENKYKEIAPESLNHEATFCLHKESFLLGPTSGSRKCSCWAAATLAATIQPNPTVELAVGYLTNCFIPEIHRIAFLFKLFTITKFCWEQSFVKQLCHFPVVFLWQPFPLNPPHCCWLQALHTNTADSRGARTKMSQLCS